MSEYLPARGPASDLSPLASAQLTRAARRAAKDLARYGLSAAVDVWKDQCDTMALRDVLQVAVEEEIGLFDDGMLRAGGDPVKQSLVLAKVAAFSKTNNRRIERRFG